MRATFPGILAWLAEVIVLCAAGVPVAGHAETTIDPAALLAGLPVQVVSEPISLGIAGRPALVHVVRGHEPAGEVVAAALAQWSRQGAPVRTDLDGAWQSVSRIGRHRIEALQLRDDGIAGSEGYLVTWGLSEAASSRSAAPGGARTDLAHRLLPPAAFILADVRSAGHAPGRTVVAWLPGSVDEADRVLLGNASSLGLEQRRQGRREALRHGSERARFFRNGSAELALTLHREGAGTALVIHLMEANP